MKSLLTAGAALALIAAPAHAQLLGGGLGGTIGGTLGAAGTPGSAGDTVSSVSRGAVSGSGEVRTRNNVDRRSGRVDAGADANGSLTGSVDQTLSSPATGAAAQGSGRGSAAGSGNASAQLVGTSGVRSAVGSAASQAQVTAGYAVSSGRSAAGSVSGAASGMGSGTVGSAQGAGSGAGSGGAGQFALAGSAAALASGAFAIEKGTPVFAPNGEQIGKVRGLVADGQGQIQQVLVKADGEKALLPAGNFSAQGNALVSAMSEAQIKQVAAQQDEAD